MTEIGTAKIKDKQITTLLLITLVAFIAIIAYQFTLIKEKNDELNSKTYQIRKLQESAERWEILYNDAQSKLKNCTQNLTFSRFNNSQL